MIAYQTKTHFLYGSMILQEIMVVNPNIRKTFAHTTEDNRSGLEIEIAA